MKIKELHEADRPRERLLSAGAHSLGNAELLAILLRVGSHKESAVDLGHRLLKLSGGQLAGLFNSSPDTLISTPGIGPCKAATVIAALELGRRFLSELPKSKGRPIVTARMAYDCLIPEMKGLDHEECWILLLDLGNCLIGRYKLTSGSRSSTTLEVKQPLRLAMEKSAAGIILAHNHPDGNPTPSRADIKRTEELKEAAHICSIDLLDHIVICDDCFFSFADDHRYSIYETEKKRG